MNNKLLVSVYDLLSNGGSLEKGRMMFDHLGREEGPFEYLENDIVYVKMESPYAPYHRTTSVVPWQITKPHIQHVYVECDAIPIYK